MVDEAGKEKAGLIPEGFNADNMGQDAPEAPEVIVAPEVQEEADKKEKTAKSKTAKNAVLERKFGKFNKKGKQK